MSAEGLKSANVTGLGRVVSKETSHYEIVNIDQLAVQMFQAMLDAAKEGRPLADGFLLQRRVNRENLEQYIEDEADTAKFGVKKVTKNDLSFTKA